MSNGEGSSGSKSSGGGSGWAIAAGVIGAALGFVVSKWIDNRSQLPDAHRSRTAFHTSEAEHVKRRKEAKRDQPSNFEPKKELECIVCRGNEREVMLFPCRHLCICVDCSEKLSKCPCCNMYISEKKVTYIP